MSEYTYDVAAAAEAARGVRGPRGDTLSDDHHVALHPPDSRAQDWMAHLVATAGSTPLWWAGGDSMTEALTNLCLVLADELEERAKYLPEDYVYVQDRPMPVPGEMRFVPHLADPEHPSAAELAAGTPVGPGWKVEGGDPAARAFLAEQLGIPESPSCKVCGCTEDDCTACVLRTRRRCGWVAEDLCSACTAVHDFDPHPLDPTRCAVCFQPLAPGDPVCLTRGPRQEQESEPRAQPE